MSKIKVNSLEGVGASTPAISINNTDGTASANLTSVSGGQLGGRNMVINGSMQCNQRGDQTSITGSTKTLDRWKLAISSLGGFSVSQIQSNAIEIATGHRHAAQIDCTTADASPASTDLLMFRTGLEGHSINRLCWGTSNAKKAVLSFWAKADIDGFTSGTKDFVVELQASDSTEFSVVCQLTTNSTWQKFVIPIDAKTSGSVTNTNTEAVGINFWLDAGSNYKGGTYASGWQAKGSSGERAAGLTINLASNTANNFYLTGVQFELADPNTVPTEFEHRSFGEELALCQRYFQKIACNQMYMSVIRTSDEQHRLIFNHPVTMRTTPTGTMTSGSQDGGGSITVGSVSETSIQFSQGPAVNNASAPSISEYTVDAEF